VVVRCVHISRNSVKRMNGFESVGAYMAELRTGAYLGGGLAPAPWAVGGKNCTNI